MATASFRLSADGGATYLAPGIALAGTYALANSGGSYAVKAKLDSTAGVESVVWSVPATDDASTAPALTTNADKSVSFTMAGSGGSLLLRALVNSGINKATGAPDPALTATLAVRVKVTSGGEVLCLGETTEAGTYGWLSSINALIRTGGGGGGGGGTVTLYGQVTGPSTATVVSTLPEAIVRTSLLALTAPALVPVAAVSTTSNALATYGQASGLASAAQSAATALIPAASSATPAAVGTAGSPGSGTVYALGNHVHALTESTLRAVLGTSTGDVPLGNQKATQMLAGVATTDGANVGQLKTAIGTGESTPALGAGGTIALTSTELQAAVVRLSGAPSTATIATFDLTGYAGRSWMVRHELTTGNLLQARATAGSRLVTFLPGQLRCLTAVNGELRADDEKALVAEIDVSLIASVSNVDALLCTLPGNVILRGAIVRGVTATVGGTSTLSMGTASGGAQILAATTAPAVGGVLGESSALGTDMTSGSAPYASATQVWLRNAVTTAAITAGAVRVSLLAVPV